MGGYFTPTTLTPISTTDYRTYVRDQTVNQFASAAARASAVTSPTEGMVSTLADTDLVERYNGTAWCAVGMKYIGQTLGTSDVTTTSHTVIDYVTFTAQANRRYLVFWTAVWNSSGATDQTEFYLRYEQAATLSTSGTLVGTIRRQSSVANAWCDVNYIRSLSGLTAAQYSVGISGARATGAGTHVVTGNANYQLVLEVYDVGPA